jgi:hypothetical protein
LAGIASAPTGEAATTIRRPVRASPPATARSPPSRHERSVVLEALVDVIGESNVSRIRRHRRIGRLLAALAISLLAAGPALASLGDTYNATPGSKHFSASSITYGWDPENPPPSWLKTQITAQITYMNDPAHMAARIPDMSGPVSSPTVRFKYGGTTPCLEFACAYGPGNNADNPNGWTIYILKDASDGGASWRKFCQYNNTAPADYRSGCYDARNVVLHELGHVLAMGHWADDSSTNMDNLGPGASITVMQIESRSNRESTNDKDSYGRNNAGWDAHDYGACDMARLQAEYGLNDSWRKVSSCLTRQTTTLTLAKSSSSVGYRGNVTFTATLEVKVDGSGGNDAQLEGANLSGRVLVLERSSNNFSTISATYAMTAGSNGTYTVSLNLTSTSQWRAYFATPTEGLSGSRSSSSTVTVSPCTIAPCPV